MGFQMFNWNVLTPNICRRNASQIDGFAMNVQWNFQGPGMQLNRQRGDDNEEGNKDGEGGLICPISFTCRGTGLIQEAKNETRGA